ncbi:hypothetical protein [Commensalibacter papalotli (ex Servin-Garciduenas et al. 2014)]|uniref:Uncharacterized protein n=1 Tax=Commensalibacter papalotli (ex Servin-Garciduenas et al. 2014) TaxID=1208583 RepID=W7DRW3_9PROT|nr:hypothetical protein [Commensalibacter papalotli (ex Servin-Garciduenas et al. 2014)]EUK17605.1 hypothetical protein COMX_09106 [Commensalibacter papalotli (ex Servin-Garciduenas et al. 2014)]
MNIYLLDRNIIIDIEKFQKNKESLNDNSLKLIDKLQTLDESNNTFSCMLSAIEGHHKRQQTTQEFEETSKQEILILKSFFKKAKVDETPLLSAISGLKKESDQAPIHSEFNLFANFLENVNSIIFSDVKNEQILPQCDKIIETAQKLKIPKNHYIVIACLAIIAGSSECRKLIKPTKDIKKENAYNVISDLSIIHYFNILRSMPGFNESQFIFLTNDQGLQFFLDNIIIEKSIYMGQDSEITFIQTTIKEYKKPLFPRLNEKDFLLLMDKLK